MKTSLITVVPATAGHWPDIEELFARTHGAPALEAYPVDPAGRRIDVTFAYVGTLAMFERAGFRRVLETPARSAGLPRLLVRLELQGDDRQVNTNTPTARTGWQFEPAPADEP